LGIFSTALTHEKDETTDYADYADWQIGVMGVWGIGGMGRQKILNLNFNHNLFPFVSLHASL
jgi:hypothetical protein